MNQKYVNRFYGNIVNSQYTECLTENLISLRL